MEGGGYCSLGAKTWSWSEEKRGRVELAGVWAARSGQGNLWTMLCVGGKKKEELLESAARAMEGAEMRLHVSHTRAETLEDVDGTTFTVYNIRVALLGENNVSWEVARRYSEFHDLHELLKSFGVVFADLPGKNPFARMSAVIRSR